ncbi:MAG TPA: hypothetical protein VEL76_08385, partial [Gemmataceae bacterium]|nr:hypothetical protein [Gemmataceae bacterium]
NGQFDADESSTETDANGQYIFTGLAAGSYQVRLSGSDEVHKVVLAHGQPVSRNFAIRPLSAVVADVSASSKGSSATVSLLANGLESQGDSLTVTGSSQGDSATALGSEKTVPDTPNAGGIGSQVVTSTASEVAASQSQQAPTVAGTAVAAESRSVTLVPSRRDQQPASGTAAASVAQATQTSEPSPGVFLVGIRGEIFGTAPAGVAELQATTLAGLVFPATTGLATDPQFSFYLKSPVPLNPPLSNRVEGTGGEGLPDPETGDENVALPAPLNEGEALGENVGMGAPTESGIWGWARDACFADGSWEDALVEQESPEWAPGPVASSAVLAMAGGMLLGTVRPPQVEERDRRRRLQSVR